MMSTINNFLLSFDITLFVVILWRLMGGKFENLWRLIWGV